MYQHNTKSFDLHIITLRFNCGILIKSTHNVVPMNLSNGKQLQTQVGIPFTVTLNRQIMLFLARHTTYPIPAAYFAMSSTLIGESS